MKELLEKTIGWLAKGRNVEAIQLDLMAEGLELICSSVKQVCLYDSPTTSKPSGVLIGVGFCFL